jgi:signal transduction histidine kinase
MRIGGGMEQARLCGRHLTTRSLAIALALTLTSDAAYAAEEDLSAHALLTLGIITGLIAFAVGTAVACLHATRQARAARDRFNRDSAGLRASEATLRNILVAEPQVLLSWTPPAPPELVASSLPPEFGVPRPLDRLLELSDWLDPGSAAEFERALGGLSRDGRPFDLVLRTRRGASLEADGRAAGGSMAVRLRGLRMSEPEAMTRADSECLQISAALAAMRQLLDATHSLSWLRGEDGRLIWVNRRYADLVGANSPAEAVAAQAELLDPASRREIDSALRNSESYHGFVELQAGGAPRRCQVVSVPLGGSSAGLAIEEAAPPRLEDGELRRHIEARFRSLDRLSTAVAVFDAERKLTHFNQAYVELWQLDPDWLASGPTDAEILDRLRHARKLPEEADYAAWKRDRLAAYENPGSVEEWWHLPDQRTVHVITDSAADGVTYLYENVTERIALESRYNALIRVQRETLDNLREAVAVFAPDGGLRLYNRSFAAMWKLNARQLDTGPHIDEIVAKCRILYDNPDEWERTKVAITAIGPERQPYTSEFDRPDGSVIASATLPLPDGGTLLTYVDVSDAKRVERALIERNEALEAADRLKTQFISHISYELRTPLTNIIGFAELLSDTRFGPLTDRQHDYLGDIRSSGKTLLAIIDDILDLATIDAGGFVLSMAPVKAREVIDAAVLGVRERAKRENVELKIALADNVDEFVADGRRVTQVLYNLLSNAIGFSPPGGQILLSCGLDDGMLAFTVKDEGVGIPEDYQHTVFDRFETRSQGSGHRGAGLGLSIVKSLVELHNGDVVLDSTPGEGTSVRVRFPLRDFESESEAPARRAG